MALRKSSEVPGASLRALVNDVGNGISALALANIERKLAGDFLHAAYAKNANKAQRGIAMLNRQRVLVQDEVQAKAPSEV